MLVNLVIYGVWDVYYMSYIQESFYSMKKIGVFFIKKLQVKNLKFLIKNLIKN